MLIRNQEQQEITKEADKQLRMMSEADDKAKGLRKEHRELQGNLKVLQSKAEAIEKKGDRREIERFNKEVIDKNVRANKIRYKLLNEYDD